MPIVFSIITVCSGHGYGWFSFCCALLLFGDNSAWFGNWRALTNVKRRIIYVSREATTQKSEIDHHCEMKNDARGLDLLDITWMVKPSEEKKITSEERT